MKMTGPGVAAGACLAAATYFLAVTTGLASMMATNPGNAKAMVASLFAGMLYGALVSKTGVKALWIPAIGALIGLAGVVITQLISSPVSFPMVYFVFVPIMVAWVTTLSCSIVLLLWPALRIRLLGQIKSKDLPA